MVACVKYLSIDFLLTKEGRLQGFDRWVPVKSIWSCVE